MTLSCGPSLQLDDDVIEPSDHVRLLVVTIAADLGCDRHVSTVCKNMLLLALLAETCSSLFGH